MDPIRDRYTRRLCWTEMMSTKQLKLFVPASLLCSLAVLVAGCRETPPATFDPNFVHAMKYQIREEIPMDQPMDDTFWILTEMFGTPDQPKLPAFVAEEEDFASLVSMDNLMKASGDPGTPGRGLYQKHCATCHGVSGDGRGATSSVVVPYPRDYRKGVFKFTSTPRGVKPLREDLTRLIRNGIEGTAMVKINELTEEDVQALTDYVIYLSWRGELERSIIDEAVLSGDWAFDEGDRIIVPEDRDLGEPPAGLSDEQLDEFETRVENFEYGWELAEELAMDIADSWLEAEDEVVEVPEPPSDFPVTDSYDEYVQVKNSDQSAALADSVQRGREVFLGKIAACSTCHGKTGQGDGQTTDYDDWTKDWTLKIGLKPDDRDSLIPLLARGALAPVNAKPRNFSTGVFHGGESASDLYLRITQGIDGTPMPAATFVEGEFEEVDVWHLINFIRSLEDQAQMESQTPTEDPQAETPTA
ncbi:c-type cytochrome [Crateriforma conspicua]|nr:c-type cytochrome [Crateriforma conspicua]